MRKLDVLIIGAGAVGNAIAREISKQNRFSVGVLEKEPDTAFGVSGRNSGVLHAGFNNKPGSLMAKLCVEGSEGFGKEAAELNIDFKKTGKLIIARFDEDMERLLKLKAQGEANGVKELRIISREELEALTGYEAGVGALWSGMTGVFDPFQYTIALAEAAAAKGAEYLFGRRVNGIAPAGKATGPHGFLVIAENLASGEMETFEAAVLINSAGLYSDEVCRMAGINDFKIYPCRGEYHILDKKQSRLLDLPIYPIPNEKEGGLGVHLTPTLHGNIMIGPSAEYLEAEQAREEYGTTLEVMSKLSREGVGLFPNLDGKGCIRSFSGVRPKLASEAQGGYADFVIEESSQTAGFIQLVGIESPGLTASIPIAKMVTQMVRDIMERNGGKARMAAENGALEAVLKKAVGGESASSCNEPGDEKMLCRCEGITEKAVLEAYDRILKIGAIPTVKGLKNRSRVTMGSCQGSFCTVDVIELLQKKRNVDPLTLRWNGFGSEMFAGRVKE